MRPMPRCHSLAAALRDLDEGGAALQPLLLYRRGRFCAVCSNPSRDQTVMCVVEEPLDVLAVERSGEFGGVYHVLGGALSPIDGIGPDQLTSTPWSAASTRDEVREVVIATDPDVEGEGNRPLLGDRLGRRGIRSPGWPTVSRQGQTSSTPTS